METKSWFEFGLMGVDKQVLSYSKLSQVGFDISEVGGVVFLTIFVSWVTASQSQTFLPHGKTTNLKELTSLELELDR